MATYSLGTIVDNIKDTLDEADILRRSESYNELSEGIPETPLLQVYPESNLGTDVEGGSERFTLGGSSRKQYIIHADYFTRQRSHIGEDMKILIDGIDDIEDILDVEESPYFGNDDIQGFNWRWERVTFDYGGVMYVGARFVLTLMVF